MGKLGAKLGAKSMTKAKTQKKSEKSERNEKKKAQAKKAPMPKPLKKAVAKPSVAKSQLAKPSSKVAKPAPSHSEKALRTTSTKKDHKKEESKLPPTVKAKPSLGKEPKARPINSTVKGKPLEKGKAPLGASEGLKKVFQKAVDKVAKRVGQAIGSSVEAKGPKGTTEGVQKAPLKGQKPQAAQISLDKKGKVEADAKGKKGVAKAAPSEAKGKVGEAQAKPARSPKVTIPLPPEDSEKKAEDVVLTDAEGRRYCRVRECDQIAMVESYCRYHYLLNWKRIQVRKKILADGKLKAYLAELTARYPDKYLEMIHLDLRTEADFAAAINELGLDENGVETEFEDEAQSYIQEVRGVADGAVTPRDEEEY